jgi:hypothetical protein
MRWKTTPPVPHILLVFYLWSDNQLNMVLGKSTKVIDISSIVKPSEIIHKKRQCAFRRL